MVLTWSNYLKAHEKQINYLIGKIDERDCHLK